MSQEVTPYHWTNGVKRTEGSYVCELAKQVEMEDTSMDIVKENSGNDNGADCSGKDDDDDIDPPVS